MGQVDTHICSKCGSVGLPGDKFCRKCGNLLKSENRCEKCGNTVQPKDRFCTKCGSSLTHKTSTNEQPQPIKESALFSRNAAALEFNMEPRKTMDELIAEGRAELRRCISCHKKTPFPTDTPPCGIALICQHCGSPLISISSELDYVRPELVNNVFGYRNRGLLHAACPWCRKKNYAITAPANSVSINYYAISEPQNPQALFRMQVDCVHCKREFWLEWD